MSRIVVKFRQISFEDDRSMDIQKIVNAAIRSVRILAFVFVGILIFFLIQLLFLPSKNLAFTYNFQEDSDLVSPLTPWYRLSPIEEIDGKRVQRMNEDLVYFDVQIPKWFYRWLNTVTITVTFRNPDHPFFHLGGRVSGFLDRPLENKMLDQLKWPAIRRDETVLFQKNPVFSRIEEFLENPPQDKKIVTHLTTVDLPTILPDYRKSSTITRIERTLAGPQTLWTYINDETLTLNILVELPEGAPDSKIRIVEAAKSKTVHEKTVLPGKNNAAITIPDLPEGVYRIEFMGSPLLRIRRIETSQHLLVFSGTLFSVDDDRETSLFVKNGSTLVVTAKHRNIPSIQVGGRTIPFEENVKLKVADLGETERITIPTADVTIETDGWIAFSNDLLFVPRPANVTSLKEGLDLEAYDFILTLVPNSTTKNSWTESQVSFPMKQLLRDSKGKIRFRLSAPGLGVKGRSIEISSIKVQLFNPRVTPQNFPEKFKKVLKKKIVSFSS